MIMDGGLGGLVAAWAEGVMRAEGSVEAGDAAAKSVGWLDPLGVAGEVGADETAEKRIRACERQVQVCGLARLVRAGVLGVEDEWARAMEIQGASAETIRGLRETRMLIAAASVAASCGLSRVVWPVHFGGMGSGGGSGGGLSKVQSGGQRGGQAGEPDLDWLTGVTDRAMLVGHLVTLDLPRVLERGAGGAGGAGGGQAGHATSGYVKIETPYADFNDPEMIELALDMDAPLGAVWFGGMSGVGGAAGKAVAESAREQVRWREALGIIDPQRLISADAIWGEIGAAPVGVRGTGAGGTGLLR